MTQLAKCKGKATTVAHNPRDKTTTVTYHNTAVVVVDWEKRRVILNSGGWRTPTTKLRMNQAANEFGLPYHVFQKDHNWFVKVDMGIGCAGCRHNNTCPLINSYFSDGMQVPIDGSKLPPPEVDLFNTAQLAEPEKKGPRQW